LSALRIKNGGSVIGDLVKLPEQEIPEHLRRYVDHGYVSVFDINGIGSGDGLGRGQRNVLETEYLVGEWELPSPIVILCGDGHWWIAFDYRKSADNPPIVFIESDSHDTLHIANNFSDFLSMLVRYEAVFDRDGNLIS